MDAALARATEFRVRGTLSLFARPRPVTLLAGVTISVFGLLLRAWAAGHIRKNSELATSGPYAYSRNPLYLGNFLLGLGFTIGSGWWPLGLLFGALFLGIYLPVMRVESETLAQLFGESYQRYTRGVPLFYLASRLIGAGRRKQNSIAVFTCDIENIELLWVS